jgi:hypothetical protein
METPHPVTKTAPTTSGCVAARYKATSPPKLTPTICARPVGDFSCINSESKVAQVGSEKGIVRDEEAPWDGRSGMRM